MRTTTTAAVIACAALWLVPAVAHAQYDQAAPMLTRGDARDAAEDVLVERIGDDGEIREIRCQRTRRAVARCEARGTLDAADPADGALRWKAKLRVTAALDEQGDDVITASVTQFQVGAVLTRQRAAAAAVAKLTAAADGDIAVEDARCRLSAANQARCVLTGTTSDADTGDEEAFEAGVRVTAVATQDGAVRLSARVTSFVSWPSESLDDQDETYGDAGGYGGFGGFGGFGPPPPPRF